MNHSPGGRPHLVIELAAAISCLAAGCATVSVATDYDRSADFSRYHTFSFVGGHVMVQGVSDDGNTLLKDRLRDAIVAAAQAKGLRESNGDPDLLIGYMAGARTRTEVEGMGPYVPGVGPFGYDGPWGPVYNNWWTATYEEGTLVLDLVDARTKHLLWRAYASSAINPPVPDQKIREGVDKVFQKFPPRG
jgi:hypothetical protein